MSDLRWRIIDGACPFTLRAALQMDLIDDNAVYARVIEAWYPSPRWVYRMRVDGQVQEGEENIGATCKTVQRRIEELVAHLDLAPLSMRGHDNHLRADGLPPANRCASTT